MIVLSPAERCALLDAYTSPEHDARVRARSYRTTSNLRHFGMTDALSRITIAGMRAEPSLSAELDALHAEALDANA